MDSSKLLNILSDIDVSSVNASIETSLRSISTAISSNDSSTIAAAQKELTAYFNESVINTYAPSNIKILEQIGGLTYFGKYALERINNILNSGSYDIQKVLKDLDKYMADRQLFLEVASTTKVNLRKLNIRAHFHDDLIFEIGLLMPDSLTNCKINNITKELNQWDKVIKTFKELSEGEIEDTEINFVSNGSLQFFIDNTTQVALCISLTVERLIKLYKTIIEIREAREKLKNLGVNSSEQKVIEKQEKDIFNKEIEKISVDIVKDFALKQIETGRLNELKVAVKGHVTYIAKCIDKGLVIEIIPPEVDEPTPIKDGNDSEAANKKAKIEYEATLKKIDIIQKSMTMVKEIGNTGLDVMKFLGHPDNENDTDTEN